MGLLTKKATLYILQWTTAAVCGIGGAEMLVGISHHRAFHLPIVLLEIIAVAELVGAVLFVVPPTQRVGGCALLAVLLLAALVHVLHGQYGIANLALYAAAVGVVLAHK